MSVNLIELTNVFTFIVTFIFNIYMVGIQFIDDRK